MKLTMKNIGVIRDAEIELDGITVLAGFNGTGKSTVSKALYGVIASYTDLSARVIIARKVSIREIITNFFSKEAFAFRLSVSDSFDSYCSDLATRSLPIPEQYTEWVSLFPEQLKCDDITIIKEVFPKFLEQLKNAVHRPDTEYAQYMAQSAIQSIFAGQINTIGSLQSGEISLATKQGTQIAWIKIAGNKITQCSGQELNANQIYLDTSHVLNAVNMSEGQAFYNAELHSFLKESHSFLKLHNSKPTFEEYKSRERVQDMIASVIHGKLTTSTFGDFMFKDDHFNEPISLRNIASGNKTFVVLQRLIENGALRANTVLIIDEPENNQHPAWQLKLAETLVLLHKELGVRLFLNTHSTYFLRAIEVYSKEYELSNHCHYYQTQPVDDNENLFCIRNVDGQTELIYRDFYMPFEEL